MTTYGCRKVFLLVFATDSPKRNYVLTAGNHTCNTNTNTNTNTKIKINTFTNNKAFRTDRKEKSSTTAAACDPTRIPRFRPRQHKGRQQPCRNIAYLIRNPVLVAVAALFAVSIVVNFWLASCEGGQMMATARNRLSRTARLSKNLMRISEIHFLSPGPLIVSASTVPSTISRFHHNRLETGNGFRYGGRHGPSERIKVSSAIGLYNIERYRGGSQDNFWQHRGKSSKRNHNGCHNENDRNHKQDDEATTAKNNPLSSLIQSQHRITNAVRQGAGAMFSLGGFLGSSFVSFATDRRSFEDRFMEPIRALRNFLKTSGVDDELSKSLNPRLGINLCLLGRVHMYQAAEEELAASISARKKKKRRRIYSNFSPSLLYDNSSYSSPSPSSSTSSKINDCFLEEARRYMRYATAVYGQAMINAAEVDVRGRLDGKVGRVTKETIGAHISIPAEDIVLMDVSNYDGDSSHLRHMVVVDHEHKKVVLSIRGTFSLEEIVLDVAAFSREFCGGEAHSEMANMAERVWTVAGPTVKAELEKYPGYEFILTGHSLGAGAACLVTILVQNKKLLPKKQKIRCFAYASPPVYTPLEFIPRSVESTMNFVHENDVVPFLSIQKVRKLFSSLRAVDLYSRNHMSKRERYKVVLGASELPKDLIASVLEAEGKRLVPKKGAPTLYIPAEHTVWLKESPNDEKEKRGVGYRYDLSNAREMSQREIRVYPDMLVHHFPARYEYALDRLEIPGNEEERGRRTMVQNKSHVL